jgi:hypothetical protein
MLLLGLVGVAASYTPAVPFFWTGDEALFVGAGMPAVGVDMFADLRRRNGGEEPAAESV